MTALDFPNSPTVGQIFSPTGGVVWRWSGVVWQIVSSAPSVNRSRVDAVAVDVPSGTGNGASYDIGALLPVSPITGRALVVLNGQVGFSGSSALYNVQLKSPGNLPVGGSAQGDPVRSDYWTPTLASAAWAWVPGLTMSIPVTAGVKPSITMQIFNSIASSNYYFDGQCAVEYMDLAPVIGGLPVGVAWGVVPGGYVERFTAVPGIGTTITDVGLAVTWAADPTRRYRSTLFGQIYASVANVVALGQIADGGNVEKYASGVPLAGAGYGAVVNISRVESGLSGTQTRKGRAALAVGTGTVTWQAVATAPSFFMVEDIGPIT